MWGRVFSYTLSLTVGPLFSVLVRLGLVPLAHLSSVRLGPSISDVYESRSRRRFISLDSSESAGQTYSQFRWEKKPHSAWSVFYYSYRRVSVFCLPPCTVAKRVCGKNNVRANMASIVFTVVVDKEQKRAVVINVAIPSDSNIRKNNFFFIWSGFFM